MAATGSGITTDTALRLARYFSDSAKLWLALQAEFDLRIAKHTIGKKIERRAHPAAQ